MSDVPFYLRAPQTTTQRYDYLDNSKPVDWFNYESTGPAPELPRPKSIWESLGGVSDEIWDTTANAGNTVARVVSDAASDVWTGVKSVPSKIGSGIVGAVEFVGDTAEGFAWGTVKIVVVLAGVVFVGLYLLGRSGVIAQGADAFRAFHGG